MEKYITFLLPIEKEITVYDKDSGEWIDKKITYKLKFIDNARSLQDSLSIFGDNFAEEIEKS